MTDTAGFLTKSEAERLASLLATFRAETGREMALLTVAALSGEAVDGFAARVLKGWSETDASLADGILVVLSRKERAVRIQASTGMLPYVGSRRCETIIRTEMVPSFKEGRFAEGLEAGRAAVLSEAKYNGLKTGPGGR